MHRQTFARARDPREVHIFVAGQARGRRPPAIATGGRARPLDDPRRFIFSSPREADIASTRVFALPAEMVAAFEIARVCAKSALIFPVALFVYTYALVTLPFHVLLALFRSLTGVGGRTVDELFSSIMLPGGVSANEADTALLRGLREKHNLAMATLRDQLDDSDSRYKVPPLPRPSARASLVVPPGARFPARRFKSASSHLSHPPPSSSPRSSPSNPQTVYEKLRESERMRSRMQHRLTVARGAHPIRVAGSRVAPNARGRGEGWRRVGRQGQSRQGRRRGRPR